MQPFKVDIPDTAVDRILQRLRDARFAPAPSDDDDWIYGTDAHWLTALVEYWTTAYDW